ncbi:hypothetical protein ACFL3S_03630 [Gemmatimonadota bacterium]
MSNTRSERGAPPWLSLTLLLLWYVVFLACAIRLQVRSGELPSYGGGVFDIFTSTVLWLGSITAILIAATRHRSLMRFVTWLGASAAAGALAIDEVFEFHEETRFIIGDDDYIKILMWLAAGMGMALLYRLERPARAVVAVFLLGFLFHTLYMVVDMGDGDFYLLPLSINVSVWAEELLEILSNLAYLTGLLLFLMKNVRDVPKPLGS